jgi:hypothetical protein
MQDSDDLTALAKFALVKPDNQRHQYGGTVGFPIVKSRLFGLRALTDAFQGHAELCARHPARDRADTQLTRGNDTPENRAWIQSIIARFPAGAVPNDPRSARTYATTVGLNRPAGDYSGRVDWQRDKDSITGRYQYTHQIFDTDDVIQGESQSRITASRIFGFTWTRVFTSCGRRGALRPRHPGTPT